jgi:flagellar hook assembly protein FlgD
MGREVATLVDGFMEAGYHKQQWNSLNNEGKTVANGMYLYQLTTSGGDESFSSVKKMVLLK